MRQGYNYPCKGNKKPPRLGRKGDIHTHSKSHLCRRKGAYPISHPLRSPHAAMAYGIYFLGGKIKKQQGYDFL